MKDVRLSIDFGAALAKLAPAQLQGTWQLPAELARLAIAAGASEVDLGIRKARLELAAAGARLDLVVVRDLGTVLDAAAPAASRHRALMGLDERGALALAALATLPWRRLLLESGGPQGWTLAAAAGGRPRLRHGCGAPGLAVSLTGLRLDAAAATRWLERNGRFAPVPIRIAGRPIARGFRRPLIRTRVHEPLPAVLALAAHGETPRLWLLEHGIISTRATVPGYPAFEAAVEMAGVAPPGASPAAMREAIQPFLEALIAEAVDLVAGLARRAELLRPDARERAARLLLEAARRDRFRRLLAAIPVFPTLTGGERRWASIADLEALSRDGGRRGDGRPLAALAADQDPRLYVTGPRPLLLLGHAERALLGEILGVAFTTPPARPRPRRSLRRLAGAVLGRLAYAWQRLRRGVVGEAALAAGERTFLDAVRRAGAAPWPRAVDFCAGGSRIHLTGDGRLLLPRAHPTVEAAVQAVAHDPSWLYPALVALLGGRELPAEAVREAWQGARGPHGATPAASP
jgi:hypothetical protein